MKKNDFPDKVLTSRDLFIIENYFMKRNLFICYFLLFLFILQFLLLAPQSAPKAVVFVVLALPAERLLAAFLDVVLSVSSGAL